MGCENNDCTIQYIKIISIYIVVKLKYHIIIGQEHATELLTCVVFFLHSYNIANFYSMELILVLDLILELIYLLTNLKVIVL